MKTKIEAIKANITNDLPLAALSLCDELSSNFEDVHKFHEKFEVPTASSPTFLSPETFRYRVKFLVEELEEFVKAHESKDMEGAADALVDLVWVAMGTASVMGLPWTPLWDEVKRANMEKVRATDPSQSKRGSSLDVIKPAGWVGPDHKKTLGGGPFPTEVTTNPRKSLKATAMDWLLEQDLSRGAGSLFEDFKSQPFCKGMPEPVSSVLFSALVLELVIRE